MEDPLLEGTSSRLADLCRLPGTPGIRSLLTSASVMAVAAKEKAWNFTKAPRMYMKVSLSSATPNTPLATCPKGPLHPRWPFGSAGGL